MRPKFSKWTWQNVSKLRYTHESARELFLEFILRIAEEGIYIRIPNSGAMRTTDEQRELYNRRPRVTWVLCPNSWHCHGLAIDVIPMRKVGPIYFPMWNSSKTYEKIAKIAMDLNLKWGFAEWGVDKGHFHYAGGKTLHQVTKGKYPQKPEFKKIKYHNTTERVIERLMKDDIISKAYFPYLYGSS